MVKNTQLLSFPRRTLSATSASKTTLAPTPNSRSRVPSIRSFASSPVQTYNTVVLGAGGVGKSALVMSFGRNVFVEQYDPTIEEEYNVTIEYEGKCSHLQIIDTAGVEQFGRGLNESHIQRSIGFVLVFSLIEKATLTDVERIRREIYRIKDGDKDIPMVVVGTKMDLRHEREVSSETMRKLAVEWGVSFYETSAKKGWHCSEVFHYLLGQMCKKFPGGELKSEKGGRKNLCTIM
ncbi:ras-domain-containing protein [Ganoderma leucocontextum]|nr:ras-domain-containing protein [Ganoderma leucocontextum]